MLGACVGNYNIASTFELLLQVPIMNLLPRLPEAILARTKEPLIGQVACPSSSAEALCMLADASTVQHRWQHA